MTKKLNSMPPEKKDVEAADNTTNKAVQLEILNTAPSSSWGSTLFEPQRELSDPTPTDRSPSGPRPTSLDAPEKKLTLFALRLATIEKTASGLGQLAFVWATVVLLGGFASALKAKDFWMVTAILVVEAARIFSRSRELEWQHLSTRSIPAPSSRRRIQSHLSIRRLLRAAIISPLTPAARSRSLVRKFQQPNWLRVLMEPKRTWHPGNIPLLPYSGWVLISKNISRLLYWLQILAASACAVLSLMRLGQQDYGDDGTTNQRSALNVFYGLALAEALMFLLEKSYWSWRISYGKLIERVRDDCDLGPIGMVSLRRFFYDAYSRSIDGSVFDGLKMDLVTFAEELLDSDSPDEQLIGAKILQRFVENERFAGDTLRKIGSSTPVIERLIEMLNWKDPVEEDIRRSAAEIISKLAAKKQQALRVAAIPGAMESIASLLQTGGASTGSRPYEASPRAVVVDREDYEFSAFNLLGLLILKRLGRDHDNCGKIGNARGLLARIIDLSGAGATLLRDERAPESRIKTVRRALQVVLILVSSTGETGKTLRREISGIVYSISNVRELLQYGESHLKLQKLGVEILTSMAMDEEARENIGATGSMLRLLLAVFFRPTVTDRVASVCSEAGEALAMLVLESRSNCERIYREGEEVVGRLVDALKDPVLRVNAGRILVGLCAYSDPKSSGSIIRRIVAESMPVVLKTIMEEEEKEKLLEVSIGLALQILNPGNPSYMDMVGKAGIKEEEFAGRLVRILCKYEIPENKVPRMRRVVIDLSITLMKHDRRYIKLFRDLGMEWVLKGAADTTSELECFNVFSGSVGLGRHAVMLSSLVDTALQLLA
ncbi:hypothetical protein KSP39_PZI008959 [Platanthera zijinensis]|uniref:ARM repeat superfamily protein n=1 Tax=Platanthera zijinensis TaxID=2320716 RepID=A0AAP0G807_9ASPA